ncbi:MAG TPA: zinc-dependent metalloprotease [Acidimicrobiia bacterium]|nr:zinc-dependent metalloprotease [Acidimicrobiia bacterium]
MTDRGTRAGPDPIDWGHARRVARTVAGREPLAESYLGASLAADFSALTTDAEALVAEFTGLRATVPATAALLDRGAWVDANVDSLRRLLGPLTARLGKRLHGGPFAPIARATAAAEMGFLLGFLAKRVLGQYDLLVLEGDESADAPGGSVADAVYYVGPNILAIEKRYAFRPRDFRLWIALHEVTHRAQFNGVPWMRAHYLSLVEQMLSLVDPDPFVIFRALGNAADELRAGRNPLDQGGLVALFATTEQRAVLDQVQALMSLLEGHGNYVMSVLGQEHVAGEERMARVLSARRRRTGLGAQIHKLLGFDAKMRQYEVGERFVRAVVDAGGPAALDHAWSDPSALPTLAELDAPDAWLARVRPWAPLADHG